MAREYDNIADAISAVNGEVSDQSTKIADILEALEGKAGGGGLQSADFTTTKSYSEISIFVNDIKAQTGFTKILVMAADQITQSGYWLYWLLHSSLGNIVKRRTGSGDIGETSSATVVSISAGTKFSVYKVE